MSYSQVVDILRYKGYEVPEYLLYTKDGKGRKIEVQVEKEETFEKVKVVEEDIEVLTETLEEEDDCVPSYDGSNVDEVDELGLDELIPKENTDDDKEAEEQLEDEQVESLDETEHVLPQKVLKLDRLDLYDLLSSAIIC